MQVLKSTNDDSVNFVIKQDIGFIEARYVRRTEEYAIGYLSSQTGCNKSCKFCHLTTTDQKRFKDCTPDDFYNQAYTILKYYETQPKAEYINWNYMARGEPLSNSFIVNHASEHLNSLYNLSTEFGLIPRFNISTILPNTMRKSLIGIFNQRNIKPTIYYSIYSVKEDFRKKWLPAAMPVNEALQMLKDYTYIGGEVVFHSAFIKGENDNPMDIIDIMDSISFHNIQARFNIVRYNPYSELEGEESPWIDNIASLISKYMPVQVVTRVGEDVKASCGMFVS